MLLLEQYYKEIDRAGNIIGNDRQHIASKTDIPGIKQTSFILKLIIIIRKKRKVLMQAVHHGQTVPAKWSDLFCYPYSQQETSRKQSGKKNNIVFLHKQPYRRLFFLKDETFAKYIIDHNYKELNNDLG